MKKAINTFFIVTMMMFVVNVKTYSQNEEITKPKANVYHKAIAIDPIDIVNTERINIQYEQSVGKKNSFTVIGGYDYAYNNVMGIYIGAGYRWYFHTLFPTLRTRGIEGLSAGAFVNMEYLRFEVTEDNFEGDIGFLIGAEASYKFIVFNKLAIEPAIRLGMGFSGASYYSKGFRLLPGVSIGYAW